MKIKNITKKNYHRLYSLLNKKIFYDKYNKLKTLSMSIDDYNTISDIPLEEILFIAEKYDFKKENPPNRIKDSYYGLMIEICFYKYLIREGYDVRISTSKENMYDHVDFIINGNGLVDCKIDIKGKKRKKKSENRTTDIIVEFLGITGHMGWIYGKSDYIVFFTCTDDIIDFFFIKRLVLLEISTKGIFRGFDMKKQKFSEQYRLERHPLKNKNVVIEEYKFKVNKDYDDNIYNLYDRRDDGRLDLMTFLPFEHIIDFGVFGIHNL